MGEEEVKVVIGAGESSATDTDNTSFPIHSTTKRTIEKTWGSKATLEKPRKSISHKTT